MFLGFVVVYKDEQILECWLIIYSVQFGENNLLAFCFVFLDLVEKRL